MHHCGNGLYLQDKFCTQCGEEVEESKKLLTLTDIEPNLLDDLIQSCPEAKTFTGRLKNSFYYKRRNKGGNITFSYWWVTLENADGEVKQISINAENKAFNNLKNGTVISLLEPTGINLHYLLDDAAKGIVTNDLLASGVILHNDDGQVSTLTNHYNCSKPRMGGFIGLGLILAIIATALVAGMSDMGDGAILVGIFISVACMVPLYNSNVTAFQKEFARKESITATLAKILEISKYQLGFHKVERTNRDDDIFCGACDHRIQLDLMYCPQCGTSQTIHQNLQPSSENEPDSVACMNETTESPLLLEEPQPKESSKKSIREMRLDKMKEFYQSHQQEFIYRHALSPNEKFDGSAWCYMVQVTDRNMNTDVSDVTYTETYTIRDKHGFYDTKTTRHRVRDSKLSGKLTVEDETGEIFEQWLPDSLMAHTEVGDYLLIGYSRRQKNDRYRTYSEYYYNISKGRWEMPESIHDYGETSLLSKFLVLLVAVGCGALIYQTRTLELGAGLFGLFMVGVALKSRNTNKANNKNASDLIQPIMDTLYRVRDNKKELLAYLAKLK
ncbi:hypothetical protein [Vibrio alfacsensis]|uniref:hypothetical protein n=1 Tax=Vibrio alfacsensis TaxID=1074311 RepID=UPI001BEE62CA|nr:hypothetical protein [Vibrio alfacsensis]BCN23774.1 hypothetical protein VYA_09660 [Vibrio alfacsensis]